MDDPIQRHPTRNEQLDILVTLIADLTQPDDQILDLGCGTGYTAHLLAAKRVDLDYVGVDRNADALAQARERFGEEHHHWIEGDLTQLDALTLPHEGFRAVLTCLTLHDLPDTGKQALIAWAADRLTHDGVLFVYDRIRLTEPSLFPLQQSIWDRIERVHGTGMRTADSFADYEHDLGTDNRPATLSDYDNWFRAAGLSSRILHLHGNVALLAAARP